MTRNKPHDTTSLIIYGAGGHGAVVVESAISMGFNVIGLIDTNPDATPILNLPILSPDQANLSQAKILIAIGDNLLREKLTQQYQELGWQLATVIHASACISPTAKIAQGTYIGPKVIVNAMTQIEQGVILNSGVIAEHHNTIQAFSHLAPGVCTGGFVDVGQRALIGINASILPNIKIESDAAIGAGSVVTQNIAPHAVAWGNPAKAR